MINLPRLVLFPSDANSQAIASSVIRDHFLALEMTSGVAQRDNALLLPGPNFTSLVTFLGCSPTVSKATANDTQSANEYFIEIADSIDSIVAICGVSRQAPHCPQCKQAAPDWNVSPETGEVELFCATCGFGSLRSGWNWRHRAGFGRQWINIWGVHEGEAVPGEKLLNSLQEISGFAWNYAWCSKQNL